MNPVLFTSTTCEWPTPQPLFDALDAEFGFTLDPCATPANAKCSTFFTLADDGLAQSWAGHVVFMNPPYGRQIRLWVRKAYESALDGATVVCLLPARTDTTWWHNHCVKGEIYFVRGRLKFGDSRNSAPFPSAIVVFRPHTIVPPDRAADTFDYQSNQLGIHFPTNPANANGIALSPCISTITTSIQPQSTAINSKGVQK